MGIEITTDKAYIALWVCDPITLTILIVRAVTSPWYAQTTRLTTGLVIASIFVCGTRIGIDYTYLRLGTAIDVIEGYQKFTDASRIKWGTIFSLIGRLWVSTFYWLQVCLLLCFYSHVLGHVSWVRKMIRLTWFSIIVTYIAVALITFLECHPFHLYWQIHPDPGSCSKAYIQLFMQGISNIVLDLEVLTIAIPLLKITTHTVAQNIRIYSLLGIGTFTIIVTCLRFADTIKAGSSQPTRSLWASVQIITSAFVANSPAIYGAFTIGKKRSSRSLPNSTRITPETTHESRRPESFNPTISHETSNTNNTNSTNNTHHTNNTNDTNNTQNTVDTTQTVRTSQTANTANTANTFDTAKTEITLVDPEAQIYSGPDREKVEEENKYDTDEEHGIHREGYAASSSSSEWSEYFFHT